MPVRPRRAAAVRVGALAAATGALLSGCERPLPAVGAFSGTTYDSVEAVCWNEDNDAVAAEECVPDGGDVGVLPVQPGETIGISVDPDIAEGGWVPTINDQQLVARPITTTYYRFALGAANLQEGELVLRVSALSADGASARGAWIFRLQP